MQHKLYIKNYTCNFKKVHICVLCFLIRIIVPELRLTALRERFQDELRLQAGRKCSNALQVEILPRKKYNFFRYHQFRIQACSVYRGREDPFLFLIQRFYGILFPALYTPGLKVYQNEKIIHIKSFIFSPLYSFLPEQAVTSMDEGSLPVTFFYRRQFTFLYRGTGRNHKDGRGFYDRK